MSRCVCAYLLAVYLLGLGCLARANQPGDGLMILGVTSSDQTRTPAAMALGPWVPHAASADGLLERIAATVKLYVAQVPADDVHARMVFEYRNLRLMDADEHWTVAALVPHAAQLLPERLDGADLSRFVDTMAGVARGNPYVMTFLKHAQSYGFKQLADKVASEGATVLPAVVVHAEALERLTAVMVDDYTISEACRAHWRSVADSDPRFWRVQSLFAQYKTKSVNLGIDSFNAQHRTGQVDPSALSFTLPLNIMEAVTAEFGLAGIGPRSERAGHLANARAGMELVFKGPHGAGPSRFSPDGQLIEIRPLDVKAWDDLYAAWNMGFITVVTTWPYFLTKLVIPSVNDYSANPESYINRRAIALEIQMYSNGLALVDHTLRPMDWRDPDLNTAWGLANRESARDYAWRTRP